MLYLYILLMIGFEESRENKESKITKIKIKKKNRDENPGVGSGFFPTFPPFLKIC